LLKKGKTANSIKEKWEVLSFGDFDSIILYFM